MQERDVPTPPPTLNAWPLLLDTHVLLELWLFRQPSLMGLGQALLQGDLHWIASAPMLEELAHVRARPWPERWTPDPILLAPEAICRLAPHPTQAAPWRCSDPDDQKFLDLALALSPIRLWSRDRALLHWRKKAALRGVLIQTPEAGWADWLNRSASTS
ncbi:putative nucleic acid-binding protein [Inhella inkyongensis]|uniref:Putative nucleic acid-binding protein n=1 Tax=Inhella inkyongensis TaxID=392593 RepID=A0A840SAA0_9BURK|nr:PIN domain-containing protein [Inhella inkyongensis]MBB5206458.1 putative nucleic acid-binding protein [Inhella inkyongensis]